MSGLKKLKERGSNATRMVAEMFKFSEKGEGKKGSRSNNNN